MVLLGGGGVEVKVWILTLFSSTEREKEKYLIQKIYQHVFYELLYQIHYTNDKCI